MPGSKLGPSQPLPLPAEFTSPDEYAESLLYFASTSWLLQTLCGGVHILDFFTSSPDLYSVILPQSWWDWIENVDIMDFLDLLMREDLGRFQDTGPSRREEPGEENSWRGHSNPPSDLVHYIREVRKHTLNREFPPPGSTSARMHSESRPSSGSPAPIATHVAVGMNFKKQHEVGLFAQYVSRLADDVGAAQDRPITHLVDFGSGQNYLGRALASSPYERRIIAVESKQHNIDGARGKDVRAKLVEKPMVMRNKKEYRAEVGTRTAMRRGWEMNNMVSRKDSGSLFSSFKEHEPSAEPEKQGGSIQYVSHRIKDGDLSLVLTPLSRSPSEPPPSLMVISLHSCGNLIHHGLRTLSLNPYVSAVCLVGCCYNLMTERLGPPTYKLPTLRANHPRLAVTSSVRDPHGFPMSDRLAKFPCTPWGTLPNPYLSQSTTGHADTLQPSQTGTEAVQTGFRLNITARMMAVQAPANWAREDSDLFFTRHFYRALLQRVLVDKGIVEAPSSISSNGARTNTASPDQSADSPQADATSNSAASHPGEALANGDSPTPPSVPTPGRQAKPPLAQALTVGALSRSSCTSFRSYVHAAVKKLLAHPSAEIRTAISTAFSQQQQQQEQHPDPTQQPNQNQNQNQEQQQQQQQQPPGAGSEPEDDETGPRVSNLLSDAELERYERRFARGRKRLSAVWSLMAFSAGAVEALVVLDRWLWAREALGIGIETGTETGLDASDADQRRAGAEGNRDRNSSWGQSAGRGRSGDEGGGGDEGEDEANGALPWCWVESVFEYGTSPRNLAIVAVKAKQQAAAAPP